MDDLNKELNDELKEAKQQLWQALLAVDGMLSTITVGIAAFGSIENIIIKIFLIVVIALLFTSIFSISSVFYSYRNFRSGLAKYIMQFVEGKSLPSDDEAKMRQNYQVIIGKKMIFIEDATIILQAIIMILLFTICVFVLFNKTDTNNSYQHLLPTPTPCKSSLK